MVEPLDAWRHSRSSPRLGTRTDLAKTRANCKMSFMHAHGDRCREDGDSPADVTRKTSVSQQARSIVISLIIEN